MRNSLDSKVTCGGSSAASRRRSTQEMLNLEYLNLHTDGAMLGNELGHFGGGPDQSLPRPKSSSGPEDPGSFGKSRLVTKWNVSLRPTVESQTSDLSFDSVSVATASDDLVADLKLVINAPGGQPGTPKFASASELSSLDKRHTLGGGAAGGPLLSPIAPRWDSASSNLVEDELLRRISTDDRVLDQQSRQVAAVNTLRQMEKLALPSAANSGRSRVTRGSAPGNPANAFHPHTFKHNAPAPNLAMLGAPRPQQHPMHHLPAHGLAAQQHGMPAHLATLSYNAAPAQLGLGDMQAAMAGHLGQTDMRFQAAVVQQMRLNSAQQQYASALAQLADAQKQMLAAAAAIQAAPPAQAPDMMPSTSPFSAMAYLMSGC